MKKIISGIMSAIVLMSTVSVSAAALEVNPNFDIHGNRCGKVLVKADIERDVEVTITQNTKDGSFDYYTTVIPQGDNKNTYEFVLEGKDDVNYTIRLGVSKFKNSDTLQYYNNEFMVYDTDEITDDEVSGYEYSYNISKGEELSDEKITENKKGKDNIIRNAQNVYFPVTDYNIGDVNMNGSVELQDIIIISKYLICKDEFDADKTSLADYNGDGKADLHDAIDIAKYLLEK